MLARLLFFISALSLLFIAEPAAHDGALAQTDPSGIESVTSLHVLPDPAVAGSTVSISWDATIQDSGPVTFNVYVPSDWYSATGWQAGTGVTQTTDSGHSYAVAACPSVTINLVLMHCASYSYSGTGTTAESMTLSFTLRSTATPGANRPVRVTNPQGSGGTPNIGTIFTTVEPVPDTRYVASSPAACGAHSPCHTGSDALQAAVDALPTSGGTVRVIGTVPSQYVEILGNEIAEVTIEPANGSAKLESAFSCASSGTNSFIYVGSGATLTIRNMEIQNTHNADCYSGIYVDDAGSELIMSGSLIYAFDTDNFGRAVYAQGSAALTVEGTALHSNYQAIRIDSPGPTALIRGNDIYNNLSYAVESEGDLTMYANNFGNNNSGGFQVQVTAQLAAVAKNWWGSYSDPSFGPKLFGVDSVYTEGWDRRLGAAVQSWAAGADSVELGNAGFTGDGQGVIMNLGRDSGHTPFGVGVAPHVEQLCSDYYDFYALDNPTGWTASLPVDSSTACDTSVRYPEVAYMIEPGSYDTECATPDDMTCWDPIPESKLLVSGANLLISGIDFGYTHIVAGDEEGLDPTAVGQLQIESASAPPGNPALTVVLLTVVLLLTASTLWIRRQRS
jgi:hypothetical protein